MRVTIPGTVNNEIKKNERIYQRELIKKSLPLPFSPRNAAVSVHELRSPLRRDEPLEDGIPFLCGFGDKIH